MGKLNKTENITIAIDAFGGDNAPVAIIEGAVNALTASKDIKIILTGDKDKIESELEKHSFDNERISILHAPQVISNDESPTLALKNKQNSSLVAAIDLVKNKTADAVISAGSTGALLAGATLRIGRLKGIQRPALAPCLPTAKGGLVCLIDSGANADCQPAYLQQFAVLGSALMASVVGIKDPRVALVSVGTEDKKGNELTKAAFELIKNTRLNFVGNMEAREAMSGDYDVLVCDGFTGNVLLKTIEGTAKLTAGMLSGLLKQNAPEGTDLTFVKRSFGQLMGRMDFNSLGGAPLLGVDGIVIKIHGSAVAESIKNGIDQAVSMVRSKLVQNISSQLDSI